MRRVWSIFVITLLLCGAGLAQSQSADSLADVARANRAKVQAQETSGTAPKVITNKDLPEDGSGVPESDAADTMTMVSGVKKSDHYADQRLSNRLQSEQRTSQQWKARIQDQENRIADLQARIDRVNDSVRAAVGTAQYDTPASRYQAIQMERLSTMQQTLDQQKRRLAMMEDAARRAGMDQ